MEKVEYKTDPLLSFADQRLINSKVANSPEKEKLKQEIKDDRHKVGDRRMMIIDREIRYY